MRPRRSGRFALLLLIPSVGCLVAALVAVPCPAGQLRGHPTRARRPPAAAKVSTAAMAPSPLPTPLPRPAIVPAPRPAAPYPAVESAPPRERPPVHLPRPGLVPRRPAASAPPRSGTPTIDDPRARYLSRVYTPRRSTAGYGVADPRLAPRATMPEDWNDPQPALPEDDGGDGQRGDPDPDRGDGW